MSGVYGFAVLANFQDGFTTVLAENSCVFLRFSVSKHVTVHGFLQNSCCGLRFFFKTSCVYAVFNYQFFFFLNNLFYFIFSFSRLSLFFFSIFFFLHFLFKRMEELKCKEKKNLFQLPWILILKN